MISEFGRYNTFVARIACSEKPKNRSALTLNFTSRVRVARKFSAQKNDIPIRIPDRIRGITVSRGGEAGGGSSGEELSNAEAQRCCPPRVSSSRSSETRGTDRSLPTLPLPSPPRVRECERENANRRVLHREKVEEASDRPCRAGAGNRNGTERSLREWLLTSRALSYACTT